MKAKRVMLDLDGVLVNFHKGVCDQFGEEWSYKPEFSIMDFWELFGVTREDVMSQCTAWFWENLEWMHDGKDILSSVLACFKLDQIYILTNPVIGGTDTATGKMDWILREIPEFYNRTILTCAPKGLLASGPDVLLIDDFDHNIEDFQRSGGQTIQVPRPWNQMWDFANLSLAIVDYCLLNGVYGPKNMPINLSG